MITTSSLPRARARANMDTNKDVSRGNVVWLRLKKSESEGRSSVCPRQPAKVAFVVLY